MSRILIGGTIFECELFLDSVFENIEAITRLFEDYALMIVIDRGNDRSLEICHRWIHRLPKMTLLVSEQVSQVRTTNLVIARNRILEQMRSILSPKDEFFIMMDMDDVCSKPIRLGVLKKVLLESSKWDAITFPGLRSYYDIWALSCYPFLLSYLHFHDRDKVLRKMKVFVLERLKDKQWIPCRSAFGGFAIYKTYPYLHSTYSNSFQRNMSFLAPIEVSENEKAAGTPLLSQAQPDDCEHRFFHFLASKRFGAQMYIYPESLFDHVDSFQMD